MTPEHRQFAIALAESIETDREKYIAVKMREGLSREEADRWVDTAIAAVKREDT